MMTSCDIQHSIPGSMFLFLSAFPLQIKDKNDDKEKKKKNRFLCPNQHGPFGRENIQKVCEVLLGTCWWWFGGVEELSLGAKSKVGRTSGSAHLSPDEPHSTHKTLGSHLIILLAFPLTTFPPS